MPSKAFICEINPIFKLNEMLIKMLLNKREYKTCFNIISLHICKYLQTHTHKIPKPNSSIIEIPTINTVM